MNCPTCGEVYSCAMAPPSADLIADLASVGEAIAESRAVHQIEEEESNPGAWRDELSARLGRYRARRKTPPPRYPSLKLPFERVAFSPRTAPVETSSLPNFERNSSHALALDGVSPEPAISSRVELQPEPSPERIRVPVPQPTAKIIEFPRFAWGPPPPPPDQLAEPVGEQLRILEVPEVQPPPPALGGITIEPIEEEAPEKRLGIDMPLHSAPLSRRFMASLVDGLIIASASALFGFIFWKVAAIRPPQVQFLSLAGGILAGFWAVYQYLLIVYSASTPGLRCAGLELTRFDGSSTTRSLRRWRIFASYLSALSLGMGYAWVFLDEDALCWHDRITHTHLGLRKKVIDNQ